MYSIMYAKNTEIIDCGGIMEYNIIWYDKWRYASEYYNAVRTEQSSMLYLPKTNVGVIMILWWTTSITEYGIYNVHNNNNEINLNLFVYDRTTSQPQVNRHHHSKCTKTGRSLAGRRIVVTRFPLEGINEYHDKRRACRWAVE